MFKNLYHSALGAVILASTFAASAQAAEYPRSFALRGASLEMHDSDVIKQQTMELGPSSEHYEFPEHRVTHFGDVGCGWARMDRVPACLHFSVLSLNLDGEFRTSELGLSQRFETPLSLASLKEKILQSYGEPDYSQEPKRFEIVPGWSGGVYLWSDELSSKRVTDLGDLPTVFDLRDAKSGSGIWLRIRLNMGESGEVLGMRVELADLTLHQQRAANYAAQRRLEVDSRAEEVLDSVRLR